MKKISDKTKRLISKAETVMLTASMASAGVVPSLVAFAADGKSMIVTVMSILGTILIIPAAGVLIFGIYNYAMAHAEGDGPASSKAQKQIFAGAMMGVVAFALKLGSSGLFAGAITDFFS